MLSSLQNVVKAVQLEGVIDHRDVFFNEEEKREDTKLCVCVSRVASHTDGAQASNGEGSASRRPLLTLDFP